MNEQITLLDVCKLPDVQIHSKTALFKHLINRENGQMLKLRENIVKLSYTNKIIGVRGDQVGIISKRLPLKFKQKDNGYQYPPKKKISQCFYEQSGFICHRNFYVQPLNTVRKPLQQQKKQSQQHEKQLYAKNDPIFKSLRSKSNPIVLQVQSQNKQKQKLYPYSHQKVQNIYKQQGYRSTNSFRSRTQSMARLKIYQKKQTEKDYRIRGRHNELKGHNGKVKSFSNLLKDIKMDAQGKINVCPIMHEENILFKHYQRLMEGEAGRNKTNQSEYQNLLSEQHKEEAKEQNQAYNKRTRQKRNKQPVLKYKKLVGKNNGNQQILVETDD